MRVLLLFFLGVSAWGATVRGERLVFHFVASPVANLTFELDAMAGLAAADGAAFRDMWRREMQWDREDDRQLDRWKSLRLRDRGMPERTLPKVAWPPNYAGFYGREFRADQDMRIAGFQARSVKDYARRLSEDGEGLVSVVKHFQPRFQRFWEREGERLTRPKAEGFARLVQERGILALAEQFVVFTEAELPKRHEVWFYLMAHPSRFGKDTMATQVRSHAPVEVLDEEGPEQKLGVIFHELVHHFYDSAPLARHLGLIEEFRALEPSWRMAAYSYLNEAVATAAGMMVEQRLRGEAEFVKWAANPRNLYSQPWIAALGSATYPLIERCLKGECRLFHGFAERYLEAAKAALGARVDHPHFRLTSRILVFENGALRGASRIFRERVPSIMHATGWEELKRFPHVPVVVLGLDGEMAGLLRRIGPRREVFRISGATAVEVEKKVEEFAERPF